MHLCTKLYQLTSMAIYRPIRLSTQWHVSVFELAMMSVFDSDSVHACMCVCVGGDWGVDACLCQNTSKIISTTLASPFNTNQGWQSTTYDCMQCDTCVCHSHSYMV